MALRRALTLLLFACAVFAHADPLNYTLTQGGVKIGTNSYDLKPDGTFVSDTRIAVGTVKIDSKLTGRFENGLLVEFLLDQTAPQGALKVVYKDGKASATVNGETKPDVAVKFEKSLFSNYHPGISATILANMDPKIEGARQTMVSVMEAAGTAVPMMVSPRGTRKIQVDGIEVTLRAFLVVVSGINIEFAANEAGQVVGEHVTTQKFDIIATGYDDAFEDPVAKYKELSQPTYKTKTVTAVKVKMRDGVTLVHDMVVPDAEGKFPVILSRTPYGRATGLIGADFWAKRGYIFISQDCRGRSDSGGEWDPFVYERQDGKDTIDWIAKQPWSNGKVGMIGASYVGYVQWAAAVERPAALKCIVPQVSPPDAMRNIPYEGGIFMLLPNLWWTNIVRDHDSHMDRATQGLPHPDKLATLPLSKIDDAVLGVDVPFFDKWLQRDGMAKWKDGYDTIADMPKVDIPALHISGWWDGDGIGTKTNWATMRAAGHKNQWLIYGPWPHLFNNSTKFGDMDYGPTAVLELDSVYLRWFDTWLKGKDVGFDKIPHVQAFLTGANRWLDLSDWPDKASTPKKLFLSNAKDLKETPTPNGKKATFTYDPAKAGTIPKKASGNLMQEGSTIIPLKDSGPNGLVYRSAPMKAAMSISGPISVDLYFSTNVKSTDFFALLMDVDEKGVTRLIAQPGKLNVSYMQGLDKPHTITPGQIYKAHLDIWDVAHQFKPGHRLALLITSTMFPTYARNLNTGEPIYNATKMKTANQVIYQDTKHPSSLNFQVLPIKD